MTLMNPAVKNSEKPVGKSSQKVSLIVGMNYELEVLPPYTVLMTDAERPYIREHFIKWTPHTKGQYGFPPSNDPNNERGFPMGIGWSKDASVTDEIFINYIETHLCPLYRDAKDGPGFRVIMKADSGPGHDNDEFKAIARSYGFYFFPGLLNGTELGQEMDQLFALLKSIMEENRDTLYKKLFHQYK